MAIDQTCGAQSVDRQRSLRTNGNNNNKLKVDRCTLLRSYECRTLEGTNEGSLSFYFNIRSSNILFAASSSRLDG